MAHSPMEDTLPTMELVLSSQLLLERFWIMKSFQRYATLAYQKKSSLDEHDFEQWAEDHSCLGSFEGLTPSMKMESAKDLWGRIQDYSI